MHDSAWDRVDLDGDRCMTAAFVHRLPRRLLAAALAVGLHGVATAAAATQALQGPQLRNDPARRIFSHFTSNRPAPQRPSTPGAILPVTNCAEDGPGSLRAAITVAEDGDTVDLTQLACSRISLRTGGIEIDVDSLTLEGPGRDRLVIDGTRYDRVLVHPGNGALTVEGLTIENGYTRATGFHVTGGGCIASAAFLYLRDAAVRNCYAGGEGSYGGAIYAYAVTLDHSIVSGSIAKGVHEAAGTAAFGGAIFTYTLDLTASTITGNRAVHGVHGGLSTYDIGGGAVTVMGGSIRDSTIDSNYSAGRAGGVATFNPLFLSNSTISSNVAADGVGGGLFMRRPSTLRAVNSTLTANRASAGGGAWIEAEGTELLSAIIFGNTADTGAYADLQGRTSLGVNGGHNLVGSADPAIAMPPDTRNDDPLLEPLRQNGGPTRTHALAPESPAIDAGSNEDGLAFDQRGYARVYGAEADIGAFEGGAAPVSPVGIPTFSARIALLLAGVLGGIAAWRLGRARAASAHMRRGFVRSG